MSWQKVYVWSKKIHRLAMWGVVVFGFGMTTGGLIMHRELEGEWIPQVDTLFIRYWHNKMATPFALFLGIMIVTGLLMWFVPKILTRKTKRVGNE